jgi:hypothetical protein
MMHSPSYYLLLAVVYLPVTAALALLGLYLAPKIKRLLTGRNAYRLGKRQRLHLP